MTLLLFKWLFASIFVILYHIQTSSAQNDYVDFLRKANDRLTVDLLSALAGRYLYVRKLYLFILYLILYSTIHEKFCTKC